MNKNINMRIIRYFADKYPNIQAFIYKDFANEIRKLKLQELAFLTETDKDRINTIKKLDEEMLISFYEKVGTSDDIRSFCVKNLCGNFYTFKILTLRK